MTVLVVDNIQQNDVFSLILFTRLYRNRGMFAIILGLIFSFNTIPYVYQFCSLSLWLKLNLPAVL